MKLKIIIAFVWQVLILVPASAAGNLELATTERYVGWACQVGNENPVGIHIWRDDGVFLGGGNAPNLRERAVADACQTMSSYHGFDIRLSLPNNLIDNSWHNVYVYAIYASGAVEQLNSSPRYVEFGTYNPNMVKPNQIATVVGRELLVPGLGAFGHIGIWDGDSVIEALNESGNNKIRKNSWENFTSRSVVWPKATPTIPTGFAIKGCYSTSCYNPAHSPPNAPNYPVDYQELTPRIAVARRAYQVYLIGGSYTLTAFPTQARSGENYWSYDACGTGTTNCPYLKYGNPIPGVYRCDTLVLEAFAISALSSWSSAMPATHIIYNQTIFDSWRNRVSSLVNYTTRTPANIMYTIGSW